MSSSSTSTTSSSSSPTLTKASVNFWNVDTFLSPSAPSASYVRSHFSRSDKSFFSSLQSCFSGESFDVDVPSDLGTALSEKTEAVVKEKASIGEGDTEAWYKKKADERKKVIKEWLKSGRSSQSSKSGSGESRARSGSESSTPSSSLSSRPSTSTPSTTPPTSSSSSREASPSSSRRSKNTTASKKPSSKTSTPSSSRSSSASRRRKASTTAANLKPAHPTFDAQTAKSLIETFKSSTDTKLEEPEWWDTWHALRGPYGYGKQGVTEEMDEKLRGMRKAGWDELTRR
ncbi:hypothetical protein L202_03803 [Cryptococcus amylolentus CBS 6039]|uniref:Uncharacterized protein n=1 Tax=Cryptococcus amylolentus CBS 6039 TaxID=1295533 RepID=A0A1E3HU93_9TREE|nr:hypothetical protein L202_03803 [Cryptococcus amylolentus CBS 6039]ODN79914.1 hypothetical protein L202_03803 [Cryptococcus amylolentus CBS 6039]